MVGAHGRGLFNGRHAQVARAIINEDLGKLQKVYYRSLTPWGRGQVDRNKIPEDWTRAIDADLGVIHYLERVDLFEEPKICISTIHAQKGNEANHIVLMAECSPTTDSMQDSMVNFDDEVRVWYVGITRAREGLTLVGHNAFINY